jgi:hypothetical protein
MMIYEYHKFAVLSKFLLTPHSGYDIRISYLGEAKEQSGVTGAVRPVSGQAVRRFGR